MNEQLQETINVVLTKALSVAETTGDFLAAQVPEVVKQLLVWHAVESFMFFFVGLVLLGGIPFAAKALLREHKKLWEDQNGLILVGSIVYCILSLMVGISLMFCNLTWLKIWVAPKLYLLEYAASLVK